MRVMLASLFGLAACGCGPSSEDAELEAYIKELEAKAASVSAPAAAPEVKKANAFGSFSETAKSVDVALACGPGGKTTRGEPGIFGDLYCCIAGPAETAKVFINEAEFGSDRVENIKVMWNRWTRDAGYGVNADEADMKRMAESMLAKYAGDEKEKILSEFFDRRIGSYDFASGDFRFTVRKSHGPAINEHLLTITAQ